MIITDPKSGKHYTFADDAPDLFIMQSLSDDHDYTPCGTFKAAVEEVKADIDYPDSYSAARALGLSEAEVDEMDEDELTAMLDEAATREAEESLYTFTREELKAHIESNHNYRWAMDYLIEIQAKRFAPAHDEDYSSENDWYDSFEEAVEAAKAWAEESEVDLSTFYIIEEECDEDGVWDEESQSLLSLAGERLY